MEQENLVYTNPVVGENRRSYNSPDWSYIPITLYVNGSGASTFGPLIGPHIARLFVVRISAFYASGTVTGNGTLLLQDFTGGSPIELARLTLSSGLATYTEATATFQEVEIGPTTMVILAVGTDGGHRSIFATAYAAQSPLRR